jgi:hypothetical protein
MNQSIILERNQDFVRRTLVQAGAVTDLTNTDLRGFKVETSEDPAYPIHHLYAVVVIGAEGSRSNSQLRFPSHNVRYRLSLRNSCIGCQ